MMTPRRTLMIVAVLALVAAAVGLSVWGLKRVHQTEDREPLNQAVSLAKSGDAAKALPVLLKFASEGDGPTMLLLAELYAYGLGVPYDERRAALWARQAATAGLNDDGAFEHGVARAFLTGERGTKDGASAVAWYVRAAEAGSRSAQLMLANGKEMTEAGITVDEGLSVYWRDYLASTEPGTG